MYYIDFYDTIFPKMKLLGKEVIIDTHEGCIFVSKALDFNVTLVDSVTGNKELISLSSLIHDHRCIVNFSYDDIHSRRFNTVYTMLELNRCNVKYRFVDALNRGDFDTESDKLNNFDTYFKSNNALYYRDKKVLNLEGYEESMSELTKQFYFVTRMAGFKSCILGLSKTGLSAAVLLSEDGFLKSTSDSDYSIDLSKVKVFSNGCLVNGLCFNKLVKLSNFASSPEIKRIEDFLRYN